MKDRALSPLARIVGWHVVGIWLCLINTIDESRNLNRISFPILGCEPKVMGIGPAYAIKTLCEKTGVSMSDVDLFEVGFFGSFFSMLQVFLSVLLFD